MFTGMAIGRTLSNVSGRDALSEVTHLGGNSGGSWFSNQLLFSEAFFKNVTDASVPLDQAVEDWLKAHLDAMRGLMDKHGSLVEEFGDVDLLSHNGLPGCELGRRATVRGLQEAGEVPASLAADGGRVHSQAPFRGFANWEYALRRHEQDPV
jgi:hypothetical protein